MKHILLSAALLLAGGLYAQNELSVDPSASKFLWTATKVTGEHTGGVPVKSGTINAADGTLRGAEVTMDMTGITCLDIENEGANAKFVGHLKGADFFEVDKHPTAVFKITNVEPIRDAAAGKPNYKVTGDLTIKGITKPTTFDCLFWMDGRTARAAASFTFDRGQYDIKYRSGTFFPEIGDKAISDLVSLTFDVTAK